MISNIPVRISMAVSALLISGCAHAPDKHSAAAAPASMLSPDALLGPGNTPTVGAGPSASTLTRFWFDSPYEPKGKRAWTHVAPDKWDETAADGTVAHYVGSDHYDIGGYHGTVVRGGPDDLNILIPDGGKGAYIRFREAAGGRNWTPMAPIDGVE